AGRTTASWIDFLDQVEAWVDHDVARVYAVLDNLSTHRTADVLLWSLDHPRWEVVFQPTSAAYINLIEPWWKIQRSLALKGRRFYSWAEFCAAVAAATGYWNAHRHPFVWGSRKRRPSTRQPGIARLPLAA
ncbi:MAG: transposase, partial [Chloroflexota bacterium]|nr:transposase [Chloroflexota bacterium]